MAEVSIHIMRRRLLRIFLLLGALSAWALPSSAGSITLFNTGVDGSGNVLADGTIGDPHYSLVLVPGGTTDIRVVTSASGFPVPPYLADNTLSRWIGPNNDPDLNSVPGNYTYRTTFDLTGFNPLTAAIAGRWSSDNEGVGIFLNGVDTGNAGVGYGIPASSGFGGWAAFTIGSGFVSGLNTLDFVLHNGGSGVGLNDTGNNPTALRVEMTGTAAVPEGGSTMAFLGLAISGLALVRRNCRA